MADKHHIAIGNDLAEVVRIRDFVASAGAVLEVSDATVEKLILVLEELASNVVKYGHDDDLRHEIVVSLWLEDDHLVADVVDDGRAFNPLETDEPNLDDDLEDRAVGGLGIHLVKNMVLSIAYDRDGERNRVTVTLPR